MATGLIGTSSVPFNTTHSNSFGGFSTVDGATLSYTCPASGVRYAVVNIAAAVSIGLMAAPDTNGGNPVVSAGMLKMKEQTGHAQHRYSVVLGPGQSWTGKASSTVFTPTSAAAPSNFAELTASALEVV